MRSIVLTSGGLDSAVCLALAEAERSKSKAGSWAEFQNQIIALSVDYGQKHKKEQDAAMNLAGYYGAKLQTVSIDPHQFRGAGSTIMDLDKPNPMTTYAELAKSEGVSPTYVPFRNGNLLSIAASYALKYECEMIWAGMHAEDARGWAYPDCTPEFIGAMANAIYIGTYHKVRLKTPLMWLNKKDIVYLGAVHNVPFHMTWSCYNGQELSCGVCPTCVSRLAAFKANGMEDPLLYQVLADRS